MALSSLTDMSDRPAFCRRANGRTTCEAGHSNSLILSAARLLASAFPSDLGHVFAILADLLSAFSSDRCHVLAVAADVLAAFTCGFPAAVRSAARRSSLLCLLCHPQFPPGFSKLFGSCVGYSADSNKRSTAILYAIRQSAKK